MAKIRKGLMIGLLTIVMMLLLYVFFPTWTPEITNTEAISLLDHVQINGARHALLVRGHDRTNPVILHVHGGPGYSDIPYARIFEETLEERFVVARYDQRGTGKSYQFLSDYDSLTTALLIEDLIAITQYVRDMFDGRQVILVGHSFGTYIGLQAVAQAPEHYLAYVGIGQVANTVASEIATLAMLLAQATEAGDETTLDQLHESEEKIKGGEAFIPRVLIDRYGGYDWGWDEPGELVKGLLLRPETNGLDAIRFALGLKASAAMAMELLNHPLDAIVTSVDVPLHFIMGAHDLVTSPSVCQDYFELLEAPEKSFTLFEDSAHFPHFEEDKRFTDWMIATMIGNAE